jgi:peptide chain release factor 3
MSAELRKQIQRRRTFAIISHPDAGKTTLTEKLLLFGGAIQLAGAVKAKKNQRSTTSDWMEMEKERGISISTAVMRFDYGDIAFNLLDTPGHNDFSEDTYRTLTAVDSVLMVIDGSKGVETQTKKLLEVCRLKKTPVITFMNKYDLETLDPLALIDNVEQDLRMVCVPMTWPIGKGREFVGVYDLRTHAIRLRAESGKADIVIQDAFGPEGQKAVSAKLLAHLKEELAFVEGVMPAYDPLLFHRGQQTPVFFGSALQNFGVQTVLDSFCELAPPPQPRETSTRIVMPEEEQFSGFVFKIQANMDKNHRDRMAFVRICSGVFERGMQLRHVRTGKDVSVRSAMTFLARTRNIVDEAFPGDIIGIPNHGTIRIADTFTTGEPLYFTGVPSFAPELFRRAILRDPLKAKALHKGLVQVCEEGAAQLFRPLKGSDYIVGTIGELQFQVIESRLKNEYRVEVGFEQVPWKICRFVLNEDAQVRKNLIDQFPRDLFEDGQGRLCVIADSRFRVELIEKKIPEAKLAATVEILMDENQEFQP